MSVDKELPDGWSALEYILFNLYEDGYNCAVRGKRSTSRKAIDEATNQIKQLIQEARIEETQHWLDLAQKTDTGNAILITTLVKQFEERLEELKND